jgi:hypothetical protein
LLHYAYSNSKAKLEKILLLLDSSRPMFQTLSSMSINHTQR